MVGMVGSLAMLLGVEDGNKKIRSSRAFGSRRKKISSATTRGTTSRRHPQPGEGFRRASWFPRGGRWGARIRRGAIVWLGGALRNRLERDEIGEKEGAVERERWIRYQK
mmetsp:Transcript_17582/g.44743  ORF Transcript_17582/g.44743 Transcript_17582/m.44743 type:complete len:109 (+) Transcript_17582:555-881(+)